MCLKTQNNSAQLLNFKSAHMAANAQLLLNGAIPVVVLRLGEAGKAAALNREKVESSIAARNGEGEERAGKAAQVNSPEASAHRQLLVTETAHPEDVKELLKAGKEFALVIDADGAEAEATGLLEELKLGEKKPSHIVVFGGKTKMPHSTKLAFYSMAHRVVDVGDLAQGKEPESVVAVSVSSWIAARSRQASEFEELMLRD